MTKKKLLIPKPQFEEEERFPSWVLLEPPAKSKKKVKPSLLLRPL